MTTKMSIPFVLANEYPTAAWVHTGDEDSYANLDWQQDGEDVIAEKRVQKPSLEHLIMLWTSKYAALYERHLVAQTRARLYAEAWPPAKQQEAHLEAAMGRPEKLDLLIAFRQEVEAAYPYPAE